MNFDLAIPIPHIEASPVITSYSIHYTKLYDYMGELIEVNKTEIIFTKPDKEMTENYITGKFG